MTDVWHHTTIFVLSSRTAWPKRSDECKKQLPNQNVTQARHISLLCTKFSQVLQALNSIYSHAGTYLKQLEREIMNVIPTSIDLSDDNRKRRGFLDVKRCVWGSNRGPS